MILPVTPHFYSFFASRRAIWSVGSEKPLVRQPIQEKKCDVRFSFVLQASHSSGKIDDGLPPQLPPTNHDEDRVPLPLLPDIYILEFQTMSRLSTSGRPSFVHATTTTTT